MLEYLAYKKYKEHRIKKAEAGGITNEIDSSPSNHVSSEQLSPFEKGKGSQIASDAISPQDEMFLEKNLADEAHAPTSFKQRFAAVSDQWSKLRQRKSTSATSSGHEAHASKNNGLLGRTHPADAEDETFLTEDLLDDEVSQRNRLQKLFDAFSMQLTPGSNQGQLLQRQETTLTERMNATLRVSTINNKTKQLMDEFMQILKDIHSGVPLAGHDLMGFFEKHAGDLKTANDSVPSFIKALVFKLLPLSAIPSIEELSKPGALLGLIKGVLQVLKTRFPAFVGGTVLMVMAVVIVMLGLFYAFKRGRDDREAQETEFSRVSAPAVPGLEHGRQVEIGVDGVRYVTVLDEDGMRIPCPEDERGVYWDAKK